MSGNALRNFAFALLDDEHGIKAEAYDILLDLLFDDDQNDIIDAVKSQNGRYYLPEASVRALMKS